MRHCGELYWPKCISCKLAIHCLMCCFARCRNLNTFQMAWQALKNDTGQQHNKVLQMIGILEEKADPTTIFCLVSRLVWPTCVGHLALTFEVTIWYQSLSSIRSTTFDHSATTVVCGIPRYLIKCALSKWCVQCQKIVYCITLCLLVLLWAHRGACRLFLLCWLHFLVTASHLHW